MIIPRRHDTTGPQDDAIAALLHGVDAAAPLPPVQPGLAERVRTRARRQQRRRRAAIGSALTVTVVAGTLAVVGPLRSRNEPIGREVNVATVETRPAEVSAPGRLAAEMATQIETAVASLELEGHASPAQTELALLVRQLVAFSRHQAKPAGFLSLNDAIVRMETALRQIAGSAVDFQVDLGTTEPVTAGEDDLEHLLIDVVTAGAGCLPSGGRLTLATRSETDSTCGLRTTLSGTAAGYGVLPCVTSPSLVRHTARCGGSLRISGETGRSSTLHVHLPC